MSCVGADRVVASHWLAGFVQPEKRSMARPGFKLPESICLDGYISTFKDLHDDILKQLFVAGVSVVISVMMISMSACGSANGIQRKTLINVLLYSTMFIPATALTYPVYNLVNRLHLYDTRSALILIYSCNWNCCLSFL